MPDYLLDTNHATHLLGGSDIVRQRLEAAAATGAAFSISICSQPITTSSLWTVSPLKTGCYHSDSHGVAVWRIPRTCHAQRRRLAWAKRVCEHGIERQIAAEALEIGARLITRDSAITASGLGPVVW